MFYEVEFSHMHASGEFRPVMRQSFSDLKTACEYAGRRVIESPKGDRLCAKVTSEDGRVLRHCWVDASGRFQDAAHNA